MGRTKKIDCSVRRMGVCGNKECTICFQRSFASHPRAKNWNFEKNSPVLPYQMSKTSSKSFWFTCDECGHELYAILSNIAREKNPTWCKFCNKNDLCSDEDCAWCFEHSFANNEKCYEWSTKNFPVSPRDVRRCCDRKFWFDCQRCGHEYLETVDNFVHSKTEGCRYCAVSNGRLCEDGNCSLCFSNSYASHKMSRRWIVEKNGGIHPRDVRITSGIKRWHKCPKCENEFQMMPRDIVYKGNRCPFCKNRTELKVLKHLRKNYPEVIHQYRPDWGRNPKTSRHLPYDFCVGKLIIEVDGRQHFEQVAKWTCPEEIQERDRLKEELATKNGFVILRLYQPDVWKDKIDWKNIISEKIFENVKYFNK